MKAPDNATYLVLVTAKATEKEFTVIGYQKLDAYKPRMSTNYLESTYRKENGEVLDVRMVATPMKRRKIVVDKTPVTSADGKIFNERVDMDA